MRDVSPTPPATLQKARSIAMQEGLHFVYVGNVHDAQGGTTVCSNCEEPLVVRDWYEIETYRIDARGCCPQCDAPVAGRFGDFDGCFGRKCIPIQL